MRKMKRIERQDPVMITKNILLNKRCINCLWRAPLGEGRNICTYPTIAGMQKKNKKIYKIYESTCESWKREIEDSSKWNVSWSGKVDA